MQILKDPLWQTSFSSALRTSIATIFIGCTTLYGPAPILHLAPYPAWSYVTAILIVTDAALGDVLHGCWLALHATVLSIGPAILSLWLIHPGQLTPAITALAVSLAALVVALPESMPLLAKKIGLGQVVLVYVLAFINGGETDAVMHPVHLAVSTAVGVVACILALLLPFPKLACREVIKF